MAFSVNRVTLVGNLTQQPELRYTQNGSAVLTIKMATNHSVKKGEQWEDIPTFHTVVVWGDRAVKMAESLSKGQKVYVDGRLEYRTYEKDGQKKYYTQINAESVISMSGHSQPAVKPDEAEAILGEQEPTNTNSDEAESVADDIPF